GINGGDAPENLARLDHDVIDARPDLVIWQTGTNAILREADADDFDRSVQNGIDRMRQAGIEIVLMDPQYAPRVNQIADHLRTIEQLDAIGKRNRVPVFHRYAVMKYWAAAHSASQASLSSSPQSSPQSSPYANMISPDGLHMNDTSYGCVAERLADAIVDMGKPASAAPSMRAGVLDRKQ
ncbi:MAG: SGNH/GDSL hydrolase family protein, partial [Burkholderiaceae bacterium]